MAKSAANYMNSQLIKMEAIVNGYVEGIALDANGYVSEGSGENVFVVRNGVLHTAPLGNSVLPGITRDSVLQIARDLGIPVTEQGIPRELLYIADEAFFTGTAAEVTPIRSVDKISVGKGVVGPITKAIQKEFYAIVNGEKADKYKWLTPVAVGSKQPVGGIARATWGQTPSAVRRSAAPRVFVLRAQSSEVQEYVTLGGPCPPGQPRAAVPTWTVPSFSAPDHIDRIFFEDAVRSEHCHFLDHGLRDDHAVEGIGMVRRQVVDSKAVIVSHRKRSKALLRP